MSDSRPSELDPPPADEAVLAYLAAIEVRRTAPDTLPPPDRSSAALAGADMMHGEEGDELAEQLASRTPGSDENISRMEEEFVAVAADYGRRHQIGYQGWLEAGVDEAVLERAGIRPDDG